MTTNIPNQKFSFLINSDWLALNHFIYLNKLYENRLF
jgi:hypothetical protein